MNGYRLCTLSWQQVTRIVSKISLAFMAALLCLWGVVAPQIALAATMIDLGTLPGGESSAAYAINDAGQVVGYATVTGGADHAFIWQAGVGMTDLGTLPGDSESAAYGINSAGQVVGLSYIGYTTTHAFIWHSGVMTDLHTLLGGLNSWAYGINDTGQIVGSIQTTVDGGYGFIWHNGVITDLGTLPGGSYSSPRAINSAGQVVGSADTSGGATHAFIWHTGVMTDLGTLGGSVSRAYGINSAGQVVGEAQNAAGKTRAFLWDNGTMTDLGSLGNDSSRAYGINDAGQIVGSTNILGGGSVHAFLWEAGVGMTDLGTLGGYTSGAQAINNVGQVVGSSTVTGPSHAFFMDINCSDTLTVTNTADSGAGSLRQASADVCWGGTITFAGDLSGATIPLSSTLTLAKAQTIDGSALAAPIRLSGDGNGDGVGDVRVLTVDTGISATLESLTIMQGQAPVAGNGGGVLNKGTLMILDSTVLSNTASWGGGIQNEGTLTVISSTFTANTAAQGGGFHNAATGVATMSGSAFSGNTSSYEGGGLVNSGQLTVTDSVFSDNEAANGGGGLKNVGALVVSDTTFITNTAATAGGGGIQNYNGNLTVTHSTFTDNAAVWGGGLYNDGSGAVTITGSTFATNTAFSQGGGLVNYSTLRVTDSTFAGNTAPSGGGIANVNHLLTVTECTFSANNATDSGGGLFNSAGAVTVAASTLISNTAARKGGGLYTNSGTLTVNGSTFAYNRTTWGSSTNGYGGGGLYNDWSTLTVQNSTFADNAAPYNSGGGLYNATSNTNVATVVQASTFSGNSADYGGGVWNESGNLDLRQTIVANSASGHDCGKGMSSGNVFSVASLFEATDDEACGSDIHYGSLLGVDPLLGPLADNGGATPTFALLPNSPAIDTASGCTCLTADQRDEPRADLSCDIGAFEVQHADSDTVVKSGMTDGKQASFGPTRLRVTVTGGDAGTITATKHLATPGGLYNTGELTATWWLTASGSPFTVTLALCYTADDITGLSEADLQAFRWDSGTLTWTTPISTGLTVDDVNHCVILTGITEFSAWTLKDVGVGAAKPTAARIVTLAGREAHLVGWLLLALGGAPPLFRRRRR